MGIGRYAGMLMLAGLPLAGCRADRNQPAAEMQENRPLTYVYVSKGYIFDFYVNGNDMVTDFHLSRLGGIRGTPDIYFEAGKGPVYLRRKGLLEVGQGYHSDNVVDVETAEGQEIEKKCYGLMKEVEKYGKHFN